MEFKRLGLALIDEQHRFGVEQRARLRAKGIAPHTLHMTATPIPRTLAQSVYADLDFSVIDELPPGRTPIETFAIRTSRLGEVYEFVRANVERGHQAYVVAPAIDEESELTSVVAEAERLKNDVLPDLRIGLLHGRMTPREKDEVMERFSRGEMDVLLATTVVEVGVDVPNASVMVILDAQRYGLAQLHQLRGRVGRGAAKSFCLLVYPEERPKANGWRSLPNRRDGFAIAEEDLRIRGPGEFAGTVQSGGGRAAPRRLDRRHRRVSRSQGGSGTHRRCRSGACVSPSTPACGPCSRASPRRARWFYLPKGPVGLHQNLSWKFPALDEGARLG